jgi:hypothetical protein
MIIPAVKAVAVVFGLAVLVQMLPAYYRSNEFDYYLERQTRKRVSEFQLKRSLLLKAREYSLPVREDDIDISTSGRTYRVAVQYTVPINLILFSHDLRFHSTAGGWLE